MPNYRKGFTLIELLVVISVIGLLASIILAALRMSRLKATDASIMSDVLLMRTAAEMYYIDGDRNTYYVVCGESGDVWYTRQRINDANGDGTEYCNSDDLWWVMAADLVSRPAYFCVDSTGNSKIIPGTLDPSPTFSACP